MKPLLLVMCAYLEEILQNNKLRRVLLSVSNDASISMLIVHFLRCKSQGSNSLFRPYYNSMFKEEFKNK